MENKKHAWNHQPDSYLIPQKSRFSGWIHNFETISGFDIEIIGGMLGRAVVNPYSSGGRAVGHCFAILVEGSVLPGKMDRVGPSGTRMVP